MFIGNGGTQIVRDVLINLKEWGQLDTVLVGGCKSLLYC